MKNIFKLTFAAVVLFAVSCNKNDNGDPGKDPDKVKFTSVETSLVSAGDDAAADLVELRFYTSDYSADDKTGSVLTIKCYTAHAAPPTLATGTYIAGTAGTAIAGTFVPGNGGSGTGMGSYNSDGLLVTTDYMAGTFDVALSGSTYTLTIALKDAAGILLDAEYKGAITFTVPTHGTVVLYPGAFTGMDEAELLEAMKAYVDNYSQWMSGSNGYGDTGYGQIFKPGRAGTIGKVTVYLLNGYSADVSDIAVSIYSLSNDLPATLLGTSASIVTSSVPATKTPIVFTFDTPVAVPSGFAVAINVPKYGETSTDIVVLSSAQNTSLPGTEHYAVSYSYIDETTQDWISLIAAWGYTNLFDLAFFPEFTYTE